MKKIYMETLGCPKNFYDTQTAKAIMEEAGLAITDELNDADVIILNTCGFINDAKTESITRIFELSQEAEITGAKLIVSGCLAERYAKELTKEIPEADAFLGVNEYEKLPEIIEAVFSEDTARKQRNFVTGCVGKELKLLPRKVDDNIYTSTIKIAEGCNNRCAYCAIPMIRGPFRSKKREDVIREARWLADRGCVELILIAQDVTLYGMDLYGRPALPELLRDLCRIDGIHWIRLMYCYEDRISDELIDVMAHEPKICHYIDIPIQHSCDSILKGMNRRSTENSIRNTICRLKKAIPDIHIRTTLITGFPGETENDFDNLMDFVEEMRFARLGVFAYSEEEDTPAGLIKKQIPQQIREERRDAIMRRQLDISLEYNQEKIGETLEVLVEEKDEDGTYIGRTAYDAPEIDDTVIFTAERGLKKGDFVSVKILDAFDYDLTGVEV